MGKVISILQNKGRSIQPLPEEYFFKFVEDFAQEMIYINVTFRGNDVDVCLPVSIDVVAVILANQRDLIISEKVIESITGLGSRECGAMFQMYKEFGFLDRFNMLNPIELILERYLEKRRELGYPKDREVFKKVLDMERKMFEEYVPDIGCLNDELFQG